MSLHGASLETLKAVLDAFNRHDLDRIMSFFSADCVLEMPRGRDPWGTRYVGSDAVREGLRTRLAGIPDVSYEDDSHFVSGDIGVSRWTPARHLDERRARRSARMRFLYLPRREDREEGFFLEDPRIVDSFARNLFQRGMLFRGGT
jgi:ketosteroid isomerase-like protein